MDDHFFRRVSWLVWIYGFFTIANLSCASLDSSTKDSGEDGGNRQDTSNTNRHAPENTLERCRDGVDNDGDSKIDCDDEDCLIFLRCNNPDTDSASGPDSDTGQDTASNGDSDTGSDGDTDTGTDTDSGTDVDSETDEDSDEISDGGVDGSVYGDGGLENDAGGFSDGDTDADSDSDTDEPITLKNCGNGSFDGRESCDDGNRESGDGCSAICTLEPTCNAAGCNAVCGDGILSESAHESCDDGNTQNGDGCSATCSIESGYACDFAARDRFVIPAVFRDFSEDHVDFEPGVVDADAATTGLLATNLDNDGKPVYVGVDGDGDITSSASFSDWYRTRNGTNATIQGMLTLFEDSDGYANRFGAEGEPFPSYHDIIWCGYSGDGCSECQSEDYDVCFDPCTPIGTVNTIVCGARKTLLNGTPLFFPIDENPDALNPPSPTGRAYIPPPYNETWIPDDSTLDHNFAFTSEIRLWFRYSPDKPFTIDVMGDDDLWVFLNRRLAIDLGGIHIPLEGSVSVNSATAETYDLVEDRIFEIALFHAERQTDVSSLMFSLRGFVPEKSVCRRL